MNDEKMPSIEEYRPRPAVIFVGDFEEGRHPLVEVLEKDYGVKPLIVDSMFSGDEDAYRMLKFFADAGFVSCAVVKDLGDNTYLESELSRFTNTVSNRLPLFVLNETYLGSRNQALLERYRAQVLSFPNVESFRLLGETISRWEPPSNFFGVGSINEFAQTVDLLISVGNAVRKKEDCSVPVDPNTELVTQALRMHFLPVETRYTDLDSLSKSALEGVMNQDLDKADEMLVRDIDKLTHLSEQEKETLIIEIYRSLGWEPLEGGGIRVVTRSRGEKNLSFAFDLDTGLYRITSGYGNHEYAVENLVDGIRSVEYYRQILSGGEYRSCNYDRIALRVYRGFIVPKVTGFNSPFAVTWGNLEDAGERKKVAIFIKSCLHSIPVDPQIMLIE